MPQSADIRTRPFHHIIYSGYSLLVTDLDGVMTGSKMEGFYYKQTRLLSRFYPSINGKDLQSSGVSPTSSDTLLAYLKAPKGESIPKNGLYATVTYALRGGLLITIEITNYSAHSLAEGQLDIQVDADFADSDEANKGTRKQKGSIDAEWRAAKKELTLWYEHPQLDRATVISCEDQEAPVTYSNGKMHVAFNLKPHQSTRLSFKVEPLFDGSKEEVNSDSYKKIKRVSQQLAEDAPQLITTNSTVSEAWQTAVMDLASLPLGISTGPATPIAGLPLYQQFFGRDALTIAWQALPAMKTMLKDALLANAAMVGTHIDDWKDEEPGKMTHQSRPGPLSELGINPLRAYFGDYATEPDFLSYLGQYALWTNDIATVRTLLPAARKAIDWLDTFADIDGDGFIEYVTRSKKGVKNQGWKDSSVAIVDEKGDIVPNPIATCEIQAYWYAGLRQVSAAFIAAGDRAYAADLLKRARKLKKQFNKSFWMEDKGFYCIGLNKEKKQIKTIASNPGHLLISGIVPQDRAERIVHRLMQSDLFSGWGIRTLSSNHPSFNPFSYHLGSVWPVENGTFALGMGRYGYIEEMQKLNKALFDSTELFPAKRLPEAIGGLQRDESHGQPGIYPKSNIPQGWSASAIIILIQSLLGLRPVASLNMLLIDPHLPDWLPDLELRGLTVGDSVIDLKVWRDSRGKTKYRVDNTKGSLKVLRQPSMDSQNSSLKGRTAALLDSIIRR